MAKNDKKAPDSKNQELINRILADFDPNARMGEPILTQLKELRQRFIEQEQPTIVKSIRLACEIIEKYGHFEIPYWNEEEDGELTVPMFEYYLGLLSNPYNKYNRDEIKEINIVLKDNLSDEVEAAEEPTDEKE
jgi:hypothetical protein